MPEDPTPVPRRHRVVWQVADGAGARPERFLRSAANLLADLGPEEVEVEVVTHGPGLDLLVPATGCADAVRDLQARGVVFVACQNTLRSRQLAVEDLLAGVRPVASGVGHLVRRQSQGWSYLHA